MKRIGLAAAVVALALGGCAAQGRLYPANQAAMPGGVLVAHMTEYGTSNGPMSITMPDGRELKGEYNIVSGGAVGFGSIYGSVYGTGGYASGSASGSSWSMSTLGHGTAAAYGDGEEINCEFLNDNMSGHGHGACRTSTGALYRLIY